MNFQNFCFGFLFMMGFFLFTANIVRAEITDHIVINEVHIDSVVGSGGYYDDWIELYNPSDSDLDLAGWSIQKQASTVGSNIYKNDLSGVVPLGGYLLLVRNHESTSQGIKDLADILLNATFDVASNNVIYLVDDGNDIIDMNDVNIIDFVGMGSSESYEGLGTASNPPETKSISRLPDGDDDDDNISDFVILDNPSPENSESGETSDDQLGGTVLLTVTDEGADNITSNSAEIFFQVNADAKVSLSYGLDVSLGSSTVTIDAFENVGSLINLTNLNCDTEYYFSIYAENLTGIENDFSAVAVFTTLPCGIMIDSLIMTKVSAKANDEFVDGWEWEFSLTIWNLNETSLKMKFDQWNGAGSLDSALNMQFSVDDGANWIDITENSVYSLPGVDISGIDMSGDAGRQVNVLVKMKLPVGTVAGDYVSSYGILTE